MKSGLSYSDVMLAAGSRLEGINIENSSFDACFTELARTPEKRTVLRNVTAKNLRVRNSNVNGCLLDDVTLDTFTGPTASSFVNGCGLNRVTLRGRFKIIVIQKSLPVPPDSDVARMYHAALSEDDIADEDWSLDVSEAKGVLDIRGYAPRRMRRAPEHQGVITREQAVDGLWQTIDLKPTHFRTSIGLLLREPQWEGILLAADPSSKLFEAQKDVLAELRSIQAIEPD